MKFEEALPVVTEAIKSENGFRFYQHGTSMLPMLRDGKDSVLIVSAEKIPPKKGEVILYRRVGGAFVLHRIIAERKDGFVTCGDNQTIPEKGVERGSILGVLGGFWRGDDFVAHDNAEYISYVRKRIFSRRFRRFLASVKHALKKILRRS